MTISKATLDDSIQTIVNENAWDLCLWVLVHKTTGKLMSCKAYVAKGPATALKNRMMPRLADDIYKHITGNYPKNNYDEELLKQIIEELNTQICVTKIS